MNQLQKSINGLPTKSGLQLNRFTILLFVNVCRAAHVICRSVRQDIDSDRLATKHITTMSHGFVCGIVCGRLQNRHH